MTGARGGGDATDSAMTAVSNVQLGMALGWSALRHSHRQWWAKFYQASFLSFSDSRTEAFYWAQMYLLLTVRSYDQPQNRKNTAYSGAQTVRTNI